MGKNLISGIDIAYGLGGGNVPADVAYKYANKTQQNPEPAKPVYSAKDAQKAFAVPGFGNVNGTSTLRSLDVSEDGKVTPKKDYVTAIEGMLASFYLGMEDWNFLYNIHKAGIKKKEETSYLINRFGLKDGLSEVHKTNAYIFSDGWNMLGQSMSGKYDETFTPGQKYITDYNTKQTYTDTFQGIRYTYDATEGTKQSSGFYAWLREKQIDKLARADFNSVQEIVAMAIYVATMFAPDASLIGGGETNVGKLVVRGGDGAMRGGLGTMIDDDFENLGENSVKTGIVSIVVELLKTIIK